MWLIAARRRMCAKTRGQLSCVFLCVVFLSIVLVHIYYVVMHVCTAVTTMDLVPCGMENGARMLCYCLFAACVSCVSCVCRCCWCRVDFFYLMFCLCFNQKAGDLRLTSPNPACCKPQVSDVACIVSSSISFSFPSALLLFLVVVWLFCFVLVPWCLCVLCFFSRNTGIHRHHPLPVQETALLQGGLRHVRQRQDGGGKEPAAGVRGIGREKGSHAGIHRQVPLQRQAGKPRSEPHQGTTAVLLLYS